MSIKRPAYQIGGSRFRKAELPLPEQARRMIARRNRCIWVLVIVLVVATCCASARAEDVFSASIGAIAATSLSRQNYTSRLANGSFSR